MRSRYAAFALAEHAYLFRTLHPDHDDHARGESALSAQLAKNAKRIRYDALAILDRDGPDADGIARVLFHVTMRVEGKDASFAELSSFAHDGTGWRYVGGVTRPCRIERARGLTVATFER
jgi:SEC-C motif-containing protein